MPSEPATGNSRLRHRAPPGGYSRIPIRSVSRMNATTAKPVSAPMTSARTRNICSSRCCSLLKRRNNGTCHQFSVVFCSLVVWLVSLIFSSFGKMPSPAYRIRPLSFRRENAQNGGPVLRDSPGLYRQIFPMDFASLASPDFIAASWQGWSGFPQKRGY
jgi:hypothetical protein